MIIDYDAGSALRGVNSTIPKPSANEKKLPYLDRISILSDKFNSSDELKSDVHRRLLIQPLSIPSLNHTGLQTVLLPSKQPVLTLPDGSATTQLRNAVRDSMTAPKPKSKRRGDLLKDESEVERKSLVGPATGLSRGQSTRSKKKPNLTSSTYEFSNSNKPCFDCLLAFQYGTADRHRHYEYQAAKFNFEGMLQEEEEEEEEET